MLAGLVGGISVFGWEVFTDDGPFLLAVLSMATGAVFALAGAHWIQIMRLSGRNNPTSLIANEKRISDRIGEIHHDLDRIELTRKRVLDVLAPEEANRTVPVLEEAHRFQVEQLDRYRLLSFQIELVRWMNEIHPLADELERLSAGACEQRLKVADRLQAQGAGLERDWTAARLESISGGKVWGERLRECVKRSFELRVAAERPCVVTAGPPIILRDRRARRS